MKSPLVVAILLFLVLASGQSHALQCRGNASTFLYGWRSEDDTTSSVHTVASQQIMLDCRDVLTEGLSFHTFVRALKDYSSEDSSLFEEILKVHNLYAQYSIPKYAQFRLGRQYLSHGVARGTMDGASVALHLPRIMRLVGFAGMSVSGESLSVRSWDEAQVFGGYVSSSYLPMTRLALSMIQKTLRDTTTDQKVGFDARFTPWPGVRPFVGGDYDLASETFSKIYAGLLDTRERLFSGYARYTYLKPTFAENSFFHNLSGKGYSRVRIGLDFRPDWIASLHCVYVTSLYSEDAAHYAELSADWEWLTIGGGHSFGFGGKRSGAFASASYPLLASVDINAGVDFAKYRVFTEEEDGDDQNDMVAYAGGEWHPLPDVRLGLRVEDLVNENYEYDVRFLSTLSVGFGF